MERIDFLVALRIKLIDQAATKQISGIIQNFGLVMAENCNTRLSTIIVSSGCKNVQNRPNTEFRYWSLIFLLTSSLSKKRYFQKFLTYCLRGGRPGLPAAGDAGVTAVIHERLASLMIGLSTAEPFGKIRKH